MQIRIPTLAGFAKTPWNKGHLIGQKRPLKPKEVRAIRVRLQLQGRRLDLALFNLAIDSKLRGSIATPSAPPGFGNNARRQRKSRFVTE